MLPFQPSSLPTWNTSLLQSFLTANQKHPSAYQFQAEDTTYDASLLSRGAFLALVHDGDGGDGGSCILFRLLQLDTVIKQARHVDLDRDGIATNIVQIFLEFVDLEMRLFKLRFKKVDGFFVCVLNHGTGSDPQIDDTGADIHLA